MKFFTKHAQSRMKKRNIGSSKVSRILGGGVARYLGRNKYKAVKIIGGHPVTVIYKKSGSKRTAITAWKG